jgi:LmbE family N-acetylglucosaminyl deacetylase
MDLGGTALALDVPFGIFSQSIAEHIQRIHPDLVITHGSDGEYGHPQHIYTHRAVKKAFLDHSPPAALMTWQAWHAPFGRPGVLNPHDPADFIRDITPWKSFKVQAALCHKTQHAMFLRNTGVKRVEEMIWGIESFHIWKGPVADELVKPKAQDAGLAEAQGRNLLP